MNRRPAKGGMEQDLERQLQGLLEEGQERLRRR